MPSHDSNRGARRAREAREALGLDLAAPLPCLLTVVEQRAELPVVIAALPNDVAGACFRSEAGAVLWVNGSQWRPRQRFTLAHELGHAWCEHDGRLEVDTVATLGGQTTNPYEIQANAFAAEFLVPRQGMEEVLDGAPTLDEVVIIGAHYGVSPIVVVYRLKQLGLASEPRADQLMAEIEERLHVEAFFRLGLRELEDRLGRLTRLPYLSPALDGTQLAAGLRGSVVVDRGVAGAIDRLLTRDRLTPPARRRTAGRARPSARRPGPSQRG
jgi:Zn-dependent peptidase ImmA (M78 family)